MPQVARMLTAAEVKSLVKTPKPGTWNVGGVVGLCLQVSESGAASWILRASIAGKVRMLGLGSYRTVTLEKARQKAQEARVAIEDGRDLIQERREEKRRKKEQADRDISFEEATRKYWHDVKCEELRSEKGKTDWIKLFEHHAFDEIGNVPIREIQRSHVLKVIEPLWPRHIGQCLRSNIEHVLGWATVHDYREGENPARWKAYLEHVLPSPSKANKTTHFAAMPWQDVPAFIADVRARKKELGIIAVAAMELVIFTATRSGQVRGATWDEFDLDTRVWTIPGERMKAGKAHRVPLSDSVMTLLESLPHRDGLLFSVPNRSGRPRELYDYEMGLIARKRGVTVHGFRSSFKDFARSLGTRYTDEASELALAHVNSNATRAAYARDELLAERTRLMSEWAEFLESGQSWIASVTQLKREG